jgi:hypothetical protein
MLFAKLKTSALSLCPYSDVDNNRATGQKLSLFLHLLLLLLPLLNNKDVNINKSILICLSTLCEFLRRLLYNCGTESL